MGKPPEHRDSIPTLDLVIELASRLFRQRRGLRYRRRCSVSVGIAVGVSVGVAFDVGLLLPRLGVTLMIKNV